MQKNRIPLLKKFGTLEHLIKFILSGLTNTGLTYAVYLALNLILNYRISYVISFLLGILFSAYLNGRIVFRTQLSPKKISIYIVFYLISFGVSYVLLIFFTEQFKISELISPILVLFILVPFNFIFIRLIFTSDVITRQ